MGVIQAGKSPSLWESLAPMLVSAFVPAAAPWMGALQAGRALYAGDLAGAGAGLLGAVNGFKGGGQNAQAAKTTLAAPAGTPQPVSKPAVQPQPVSKATVMPPQVSKPAVQPPQYTGGPDLQDRMQMNRRLLDGQEAARQAAVNTRYNELLNRYQNYPDIDASGTRYQNLIQQYPWLAMNGSVNGKPWLGR